MAFASIIAPNQKLSNVFTRHLVVILLSVWAIYVYRDLWPLATFTLQPADAAEGVLLWVKLWVLTFAAGVIPLLIPRSYIPVDAKVRTYMVIISSARILTYVS